MKDRLLDRRNVLTFSAVLAGAGLGIVTDFALGSLLQELSPGTITNNQTKYGQSIVVIKPDKHNPKHISYRLELRPNAFPRIGEYFDELIIEPWRIQMRLNTVIPKPIYQLSGALGEERKKTPTTAFTMFIPEIDLEAKIGFVDITWQNWKLTQVRVNAKDVMEKYHSHPRLVWLD